MQFMFSFLTSLFLLAGVSHAQSLSFEAKMLSAQGEAEADCVYALGDQIRKTIFADSEDVKHILNTEFKHRWGLDGWKYWLTVTQVSAKEQSNYSLNMRVKFSRNSGGAHSLGSFANYCSIDTHVGNPLYVTNENGETVAWLQGKTVLRRTGEAVMEVIGEILIPMPKKHTPPHTF